MTSVTGSDGLTYSLENSVLTITGTGPMTAIALGKVDTDALDASSATSVIIGEGITTVAQAGFRQCSSLASASLPSTLTTLNIDAFQWAGLTSIDIPANVTYIGGWAFNDCPNLTTVYFRQTTAPSINTQAFNKSSAVAVTFYSAGWADATVLTSAIIGNTIATFVNGLVTDYQKLMYSGYKIQVDSAIRDGNGKKIDTCYQEKLVSNTNIKTINGESLLGSGNISAGLTITTHEIASVQSKIYAWYDNGQDYTISIYEGSSATGTPIFTAMLPKDSDNIGTKSNASAYTDLGTVSFIPGATYLMIGDGPKTLTVGMDTVPGGMTIRLSDKVGVFTAVNTEQYYLYVMDD